MTKVLLTGFESFGNATLNPSGEIVKQISGDNIVTAILPVAYSQSGTKLLSLINQHKPDVVVMLGQAEGRNEITPEQIALNLDDARMADNEGVLRNDSQIIANGPVAHESTLPIEKAIEAIKAKGIPASVSLSAGSFLCNHIFYLAQDRLKDTSVRSGFIHVPLMDEQAEEFPGLPTMPLHTMVEAIRTLIQTTLE